MKIVEYLKIYSRRLWLTLTCMLLLSCTSMRSQSGIDELETRIKTLSTVQGSYIEFNWVGENNSADTPELGAALDRAMKCSEPSAYRMASQSAVLAQSASLYSLDEKYEKARTILEDMISAHDKCAENEKITMTFVLIVDGHQALTLRGWLDEVYSTAIAYHEALLEKRQKSQIGAILVGAMVAGMAGVTTPYTGELVAVRPYVRPDGTLVQGHVRTAPNAYCFDNLSGCR